MIENFLCLILLHGANCFYELKQGALLHELQYKNGHLFNIKYLIYFKYIFMSYFLLKKNFLFRFKWVFEAFYSHNFVERFTEGFIDLTLRSLANKFYYFKVFQIQAIFQVHFINNNFEIFIINGLLLVKAKFKWVLKVITDWER